MEFAETAFHLLEAWNVGDEAITSLVWTEEDNTLLIASSDLTIQHWKANGVPLKSTGGIKEISIVPEIRNHTITTAEKEEDLDSSNPESDEDVPESLWTRSSNRYHSKSFSSS